MQATNNKDYIHGYSPAEQKRLIAQADILAPSVFPGLRLPDSGRLLELGCGVGAQLKRIAVLKPGLELFGIDLNHGHLLAAGDHLSEEIGEDRVHLLRANAARPPFAAQSFDHIITIWMLEHVPDPGLIIDQTVRLLRPGGTLVCTEVDNRRFGFLPPHPGISDWWDRFNRFQTDFGGKPFVGATLEETAQRLGLEAVEIEDLHILDSREDAQRREILLDYLEDLLLSGSESLMDKGYADQTMLADLKRDFARARDSGADFFYHGTRLIITKPG